MAGIIVGWDGTIANIPSGWNLCNGTSGTPNLLDKYLKSVGTSENPGTTGGATTHIHTSDAHNHTQDAHAHANATTSSESSSYNRRGTVSGSASPSHTHILTINSTTATNQNTTVTLDSTSTDPPYYKVAFIYDSLSSRYAIGSIILWNSATSPNGWSFCDGTAGTPDLRNKFLKSVGSGEDPGGTGGGSDSHTHTNSAHNHTQDSHTHTATHNSPSGYNYLAGFTMSISTNSHSHSVTINSATATNQTSSVTINNTDGQPAYYKLLFIKNTGSATNRPKNSIVIWSGIITTIPAGYVLCDGNNSTPNLLDYFIKGANSSAELGNMGGSATHSHTASAHAHTQDSHIHTVANLGNASGSVQVTEDSAYAAAYSGHSHTCADLTAAIATNQNTTISVNSTNSEPPYYEVAFIMQNVELDIGAFAFMM